jgi:hypothetical protein
MKEICPEGGEVMDTVIRAVNNKKTLPSEATFCKLMRKKE